jgi:TRAP-type mannitol/chloroaromatic compound transport system permease small subunit
VGRGAALSQREDQARLKGLIRFLDRVSGTSGAIAAWLVIPLIAASCYEVFSRYVLGAPTFWAYEVGTMVMGTHFLIGLAYTLREREHVRVDFLYAHVSPKKRALIDAFTYVALVLPVAGWLTVGLWAKVQSAYESHERTGMSAFNPVIWPFRLIMCTAFALLFLQTIAELLRAYEVLRKPR